MYYLLFAQLVLFFFCKLLRLVSVFQHKCREKPPPLPPPPYSRRWLSHHTRPSPAALLCFFKHNSFALSSHSSHSHASPRSSHTFAHSVHALPNGFHPLPTTALFSVKRTAPQICHSLSVSNRFCFSLHFHAAGAFLRFLCSTSTVTPMRCQYCASCCASRAAAVTAANLLPPALRHTALFASEKLFLRFAPCLALDATLPTPLSFLCPFPFIWRGRRASVVSFWSSRLCPLRSGSRMAIMKP